ncbi:RDD family protein [Streptomyces sp. NPDC058157]|uniref:RDD family protein n=1 Tax=Streptomyces sp. NPDC058157 TaxID=3346360 RepID=UPI0036E6B913
MTASPGDGEHAAREGYYPDPSIPGYVRYWNGAAWVPGTSRPAPAPAPVEETGPVFLDETSATGALPDPGPGAAATAWRGDAEREREGGGWQADPAHQAGFGGPRDVRVSWGGPEPEDARPGGISLARPAAAAPAPPAAPAARRLPAQAAAESVGILSARPPAWPYAPATGVSGLTSSWPEATAPAPAPAPAPVPPEPGRGWSAAPGTPGDSARAAGFPDPARWPAGASEASPQARAARAPAPAPAWAGDPADGVRGAGVPAGDTGLRAAGASAPAPAAADAARAAGGSASASASASAWAGVAGEGVRGAGVPAADPGPWAAGAPASAAARAGSRYPGPEGEPVQAWAGAPGQAPADAVRAAGGGAAGPARERAGTAGESDGRWSPGPAHPGPEEGAAHGRRRPDAPAGARSGAHPGPAPAGRAEAPAAHAPSSGPAPAPGEDARAVFERMAERAVRPAGLVRRGLARLLDSLVLAGVAVGVAAPLVPGVTAHLQAKVDAARASGRTTTVWLLDATTAGRLGLVLGALLLFGLLYEVLPTARWGRTPGKKLCGVRVLGTATLRPPGFGKALLRWLVYGLLGVPGSLWCLVDRPRRRAWHDKAARTFVTR